METKPKASIDTLRAELRNQSILLNYDESPHTPAFLTTFFSQIWKKRGEKMGQSVEVLQCNYAQEEIEELERNGRRISYIPPELLIKKNQDLLQKIWPGMTFPTNDVKSVIDKEKLLSGWFDYEAETNTPNTSTTIGELENKFGEKNQKIMNLMEYMIAALDHYFFTGEFFDRGVIDDAGSLKEYTYSRLSSKYSTLSSMFVRFTPGGCIDYYLSAGPDYSGQNFGGRSVGRPSKSNK